MFFLEVLTFPCILVDGVMENGEDVMLSYTPNLGLFSLIGRTWFSLINVRKMINLGY